MGIRKGRFFVDEELWDDQQRAGGSHLLELLCSFEKFSSRRVSASHQHDRFHIEVTATFDEFEEIGSFDPVPEYRFTWHRHEDGTVTRDKAERI